MKKSIIKYKKVKRDSIDFIEIFVIENAATGMLINEKFGADVFLEYTRRGLPYYVSLKGNGKNENAILICLEHKKAVKHLSWRCFGFGIPKPKPDIFKFTLKKGDVLIESDFNFIISEMKRCGSRLMDICKYFEENTLCEVEI